MHIVDDSIDTHAGISYPVFVGMPTWVYTGGG